MIKPGLSFDDILFVPQKSNILPRETDIRTSVTRNMKIDIPILSSPMDTVTEYGMAIAMAKAGGLGFIHKNMSAARQTGQVKKVKARGFKVGAAISVGDEQFARAVKLVSAGVDILVVDTAHG